MLDENEKLLLENCERETKVLIIEAWGFLDDLMLKAARKEDVEARFKHAQESLDHLRKRMLAIEATLEHPESDRE